MRRRAIHLLVALSLLSACKGDPVGSGAVDGDPAEEDSASDGFSDAPDDVRDDDAMTDASGGDTRVDETTVSDTSIATDSGTTDTRTGDTGATDTRDTSAADTRDGAAPPIGDGGGGCPGGRGPDMIAVPAKRYCIDTTEVTAAQFNEFLLDTAPKPKAPAIPPYCESRALPATVFHTTFPRVDVEWCHAYSFCKWAGKRLCGRHVELGGGENVESNGNASSTSQWSYACRGGDPGTRYPYGASYVKATCAGDDNLFGAVSLAEPKYDSCHPPTAPFTALRHMSGNVFEWEDSCNGAIAPGTSCRTRGGAYDSDPNGLACDANESWELTNSNARVGFRCCADLP